MAKTVRFGKSSVTHLEVGPTLHSPLCGAVMPQERFDGTRTTGYGDVTCTDCKRVLLAIATNVVATK